MSYATTSRISENAVARNEGSNPAEPTTPSVLILSQLWKFNERNAEL